MKNFTARTRFLLILIGASISLSACDPVYGGVTNYYPEPVTVTLLSNDPRHPSDTIGLAAGRGFAYREPKKLLGLTVKTADGKTKTYDSDAIESIAESIHEPNEKIMWAVSLGGLSPRCVDHWLIPACIH